MRPQGEEQSDESNQVYGFPVPWVRQNGAAVLDARSAPRRGELAKRANQSHPPWVEDSLESGEVPEWSNGPDSKSGVRFSRTVGSNPTLSAITPYNSICYKIFHFVPTYDPP